MSNQRTKRRTGDLSLEEILDVTVELLDEGGIAAFSMRTLAQRLGTGTMSTYRHVESRESLIELAADAVQSDLPDVASLPWYERLEVYARHGWTTTWSLHPWVVEYIDRGGASEQAQQRRIAMEQVFRDAGFDDDDVLRALVAHWSFVVGTLRLMIDTRASAGREREVDEAVFDFNLRTWILGLMAMAQELDPSVLDAMSAQKPARPNGGRPRPATRR